MLRKMKYYTRKEADGDERGFVLECEAGFEEQLDRTVKEISEKLREKPETRIITLSGPTCSGKTTTAGKIISSLREMGMRVFVVSLDDFFKTIEGDVKLRLEANMELDLDSVDAIDIAYLRKFISGIFRRENVYMPHFDFHRQRCVSYRLIESDHYDIFLFEGIQAVYSDVRALLSDQPFISIFTNAASCIQIGEVFFDCREIRFMRRILRDKMFRSASAEFTIQIWKNVAENEEKSIFPNEKYADIILDSTLAYEPCVIKKPLLELLLKISPSFSLYALVKELVEKLESVPEIPASFVPEKSVFREFIGTTGL